MSVNRSCRNHQMLYTPIRVINSKYNLNEYLIGPIEMAENPKVEVLEDIITGIRLMLAKSREVGLDSLVYRLEAAALEAEQVVTGVPPAMNSKPAK